MPPVTAENILTDLSKQLDSFIRFLKTDLTPVILGGGLGERSGERASELVATGRNTQCWIQRLQEIHHWTNLALWEEDWLHRSGGSKPRACSGSHRLGTMATFIQQEGLPSNSNTTKAIQLGRKLRRFESRFGYGITLLFIPVLPAFRRLSLAEEARAMEILGCGGFPNITHQSQGLAFLRFDYQCAYGLYPSEIIRTIWWHLQAELISEIVPHSTRTGAVRHEVVLTRSS